MEKRLKVLGIVSVILGVAAAALCIIPNKLFFAILIGFIGMICSCIYVFINTKNEINTRKFTAGILGMILSSVPVIFMLIFIIIAKMNR